MGFKKILNVFIILFISLSSILGISNFFPNLMELNNNSIYVNNNENKKTDLVVEEDAIILQPDQTSARITTRNENGDPAGSLQVTFYNRVEEADNFTYNIKTSVWGVDDQDPNNNFSTWYYLYIYDAETNEELESLKIADLPNGNTYNQKYSLSYPKEHKYIKISIESHFAGSDNFTFSPFFYLYIHREEPTIENFSVTNVSSTKASKSSINVSWTILDPSGYIDTIEIINTINNQIVAVIPPTMLTATNHLITNLEGNQNYSLSLVVNWSDDIIDLYDSVTTEQIDIITDAQIPIINNFELINTSENSATIQISYEDPDSIVDSITLHDKNDIINDIILSPSDLTNGRYEIKNLEIGDYDLELTLHWTSKTAENSITWPQSLNFSISNISNSSTNPILLLWFLIGFIVIIWLILVIFLILKRNKKSDFYNLNQENQM